MAQITAQIIDLVRGRPAADLNIELFAIKPDGKEERLGRDMTGAEGRVLALHSNTLPGGIYKIVFHTGAYFAAFGLDSFFPGIEILFKISGDGQPYTVQVQASPFGYVVGKL